MPTRCRSNHCPRLPAGAGAAQTPNRIECFDISNTQGGCHRGGHGRVRAGRAAQAAFTARSTSRVSTANDFASMREALTRRFKRYLDGPGQWRGAQPADAAGQEGRRKFHAAA